LLFRDVGFCGGRKTGGPGENPLSKVNTNNKLNPHMALGWKSNPGHVVGRQALSPL